MIPYEERRFEEFVRPTLPVIRVTVAIDRIALKFRSVEESEQWRERLIEATRNVSFLDHSTTMRAAFDPSGEKRVLYFRDKQGAVCSIDLDTQVISLPTSENSQSSDEKSSL